MGPLTGIALLFGLAPDGVCLAGRSPGRRWALTPPFHPYRPRRPAVSFLLHFPSGHPHPSDEGWSGPPAASTNTILPPRQVPRIAFPARGGGSGRGLFLLVDRS